MFDQLKQLIAARDARRAELAKSDSAICATTGAKAADLIANGDVAGAKGLLVPVYERMAAACVKCKGHCDRCAWGDGTLKILGEAACKAVGDETMQKVREYATATAALDMAHMDVTYCTNDLDALREKYIVDAEARLAAANVRAATCERNLSTAKQAATNALKAAGVSLDIISRS